jgi:hypothetical protein
MDCGIWKDPIVEEVRNSEKELHSEANNDFNTSKLKVYK